MFYSQYPVEIVCIVCVGVYNGINSIGKKATLADRWFGCTAAAHFPYSMQSGGTYISRQIGWQIGWYDLTFIHSLTIEAATQTML